MVEGIYAVGYAVILFTAIAGNVWLKKETGRYSKRSIFTSAVVLLCYSIYLLAIPAL